MGKTTTVHSAEGNIRQIVHEELEKTGLAVKMESLTEKVEGLTEKVDRIMEVVDGIAGEIKNYRQEQDMMSFRISEHTDQLEDHEIRIKHIEHPTA